MSDVPAGQQLVGPNPVSTNKDLFTGIIPWKDMQVLIVGAHQRKGYIGSVKDVHLKQLTASGLRLTVRLYGVADSGYTEVIDYDNVVEEL